MLYLRELYFIYTLLIVCLARNLKDGDIKIDVDENLRLIEFFL
jgi:hypothetical protein